jgi:hypothetical protein
MSLVHTEQLFPTQRLEIILNGQAPRSLEVLWCRRWTHGRYIIGCQFVADPNANIEQEPLPSRIENPLGEAPAEDDAAVE